MFTMADFLAPFWSHFPEALAGTEARRKIDGVAALFPGSFAFRSFGFECPLYTEAPDTDFSLTALIHPGAEPASAESRPEAFPDVPFGHPIWKRMKQLEADWGNPAFPLAVGMKNVLFEFDIATLDISSPVPAVFLTMDLNGTDRPSLFCSLARLTGKPIASPLEQSISQVLDALPPLARAPHAGAMLSRPTGAFRFNIRMSLHAVREYLDRIGWQGPKEMVGEMVDFLLAEGHILTFLDIDIGEGIGGRIGLECFFHPGKEGGIRLGTMLGKLIDRGWCTRSKGRALEGPGMGFPVFVREGGPEGNAPALPIPQYVTRRVSHLKFSIAPDRSVTVKAYVVAQYSTTPPASIYEI